jgi:dTDP-4-dehydrorhamnose 3,5-epimerase-like enzyme
MALKRGKRYSIRKLPVSEKHLEERRIVDSRGEVAQVVNGGAFRHLMLLETRRGAVRGNHYHKKKDEWFYVVKGSARLVLRDAESGEKSEEELRAGDKINVKPGVAHALVALEDSLIIEFSPHVFNPGKPDTFPMALI